VQGSGATIVYDFGVTVANQATAVIGSVAPGQSGTLTFQVGIASDDTAAASGQLAGVLNNTASLGYNDGVSNIGPVPSNTFAFTVSAVTMTGQTVASAAQGSTVAFTNIVRNNGNATDSFDITRWFFMRTV
jgi:trimeric autotransporter adhesin